VVCAADICCLGIRTVAWCECEERWRARSGGSRDKESKREASGFPGLEREIGRLAGPLSLSWARRSNQVLRRYAQGLEVQFLLSGLLCVDVSCSLSHHSDCDPLYNSEAIRR
jgi:hypothetical protein